MVNGLRRAGATPAEAKQFRTVPASAVPADLKGWQEYLRSATSSVFSDYLKGERVAAREQARQRIPKAIFLDAVPVRSCESLRELSIPNTTIDIATIDETDKSCRITASVNHPPAKDRVKVFIALPVKDWNGRFQGTGGGGFWGGGPENLKNPVAKGYAVGATDTGHEGGSGSFALSANGRLNWQDIRDNAYLGIHDMTALGPRVYRSFYGIGPKFSYFVEAQRLAARA